MMVVYISIWGCMLLAGISSVWALAWCISKGQMRDTQAQARSIFDDETPEETDGRADLPQSGQAKTAAHADNTSRLSTRG